MKDEEIEQLINDKIRQVENHPVNSETGQDPTKPLKELLREVKHQ